MLVEVRRHSFGLEAWITERLVASDRFGRHALGRAHRGTHTCRHRGPIAVGVTQVCGNRRIDDRVMNLQQQAVFLRSPQVGSVDGDKQIGLGLDALRLEAVVEGLRVAAEQFDLDARLAGERGERFLAPVVGTTVVDDERVVVTRRVLLMSTPPAIKATTSTMIAGIHRRSGLRSAGASVSTSTTP